MTTTVIFLVSSVAVDETGEVGIIERGIVARGRENVKEIYELWGEGNPEKGNRKGEKKGERYLERERE